MHTRVFQVLLKACHGYHILSDASNRWVHRCNVMNYKPEREISPTAGQMGKKLPVLPEQLTHYRPDPGMLRGT